MDGHQRENTNSGHLMVIQRWFLTYCTCQLVKTGNFWGGWRSSQIYLLKLKTRRKAWLGLAKPFFMSSCFTLTSYLDVCETKNSKILGQRLFTVSAYQLLTPIYPYDITEVMNIRNSYTDFLVSVSNLLYKPKYFMTCYRCSQK